MAHRILLLAETTRGSRDARDEIINSLRENNIVIPIINSVTSVNLKKAGMAIGNSVTKKTTTIQVVLISFAVIFG